MKIVVLYHPKSDQGGLVLDYAKEFEKAKQKVLDLVSLESREGAAMANLYDVTQYPAFLVISEDGHLQKLWQGNSLPLMDELSYYEEEPHAMVSHEARAVMPIAHPSVL